MHASASYNLPSHPGTRRKHVAEERGLTELELIWAQGEQWNTKILNFLCSKLWKKWFQCLQSFLVEWHSWKSWQNKPMLQKSYFWDADFVFWGTISKNAILWQNFSNICQSLSPKKDPKARAVKDTFGSKKKISWKRQDMHPSVVAGRTTTEKTSLKNWLEKQHASVNKLFLQTTRKSKNTPKDGERFDCFRSKKDLTEN